MKKCLHVLSEIERKNSKHKDIKKFNSKSKDLNFKDVISKLKINSDAFGADEMDVDDFGRPYRFKNVIIQVVKDYMAFSKQILILKIMRWYALKNQSSGIFNKDGMVIIMTSVYKSN